MINASGRLLHELLMVELTQPHGLIVGITMDDEALRVQCLTGPAVTIPIGADRCWITEMLSQATGPLATPFTGEPQTYPCAPTSDQL